MSTIQCKGCGKRIIQKGEECPHCGEPIPQENISPQSSNGVKHIHKTPKDKEESSLITCPVSNK